MTVSQKRYDDEFKRICMERLLSGGRQLKPLARERHERQGVAPAAAVRRGGEEGRRDVKGEAWAAFADRKGDCGRDLALYVARMNCGLSIPELASHAGAEAAAVSKAIQRMGKRLSCDRRLKSLLRKVLAEIGVRAT